MTSVLTFFPLCASVAFVCTAVKEPDDEQIAGNAARLFAYISGGILAFVVVVQGLTAMLG